MRLRPGRSVLALLLAGLAATAAAQDPTVFFPARYYPDAPGLDGAVPIFLEPGQTSPTLSLSLSSSGGSVALRLLSEGDAQPLEGILVEVQTGRFRSVARTGSDGWALITGVPAGWAVARTRPDDPRSEVGGVAIRYAPGVVDLPEALRVLVADGTTTPMGDLPLPEAGRIKARVARPEGGPWAGILVVLRATEGSFHRNLLTDGDGRVTFGGLEPGSYRLWADTRGTDAIPEAWDGSRDTLASASLAIARGILLAGIEITPDRGAQIRGTIRHQDTHAGLEGLEVQVFSTADPSWSLSVVTNEFGFYVASGLPSGSYRVFVPAIRRYHPNAETEAEARTVTVVEPGEQMGIDVEGRPDPDCQLNEDAAGVIEGTVRADFAALPSARIVVWSEEDTLEQTVTEEGLYRIGCLNPGSYRAAFVPNGVYRRQYHPGTSNPDSAALIAVTAGDTVVAIDFRPERAVVIEGMISAQAEGLPLEGIPVVAILEESELTVSGQTDAGGFFRFDHLDDGTGLPAGAWIVGTDSITIPQVSTTPIRAVRLQARVTGRGVLLDLTIPQRDAIGDWWVERRDRTGVIVRFADAAAHPEGLGARQVLDPTPSTSPEYRLTVLFLDGRDPVRSGWVSAAPAPTPRSLLFPQPWDGRRAIHLPHPPASGKTVLLLAPDGRVAARVRADGDRIDAAALGHLASGVYFLRWSDRTGAVRSQRLVIDR